ncbi:MAG TPA: DnaA/Hda family protein [Gemmatimonadales bacterium]|nr:DnaA/Hda family protein [Gemmatimonadales bacterium]
MTDQLNPRFRFDAYVVGTANRLAVTAAKAVAESPGTAYNPLFVYGGPGLGKTHLLMAVGHLARQITPSLTVDYITCDDFVEAFHAAIGAGQGDAYRRRYAETGLLLLDDVQFLTHRREVQAELLRLVDMMTTAGGQIVMSSDRPPAEIEALDERLIQRFAGGLVIDVGAPDIETRVAILRRQAEERGQKLPADVLEVVATLIDGNVRELIGGLNRLIAWQSVSDTPLDPATAREVLGGGPPPSAGGPPPSAAASAAVPAAAPPPAAPEPGEFDSFLSDITTTVSAQVEAWRARVGEAILRWEGEGYRTTRLSALLEQESPGDPMSAILKYEADVAALRELEAEVADLEPQLAGNAAFRDPDDLAGARSLADKARAGSNPPPGPSPLYQLEAFVEGPSNRIAVRAAHGVVEEPATKYNPFVVVAGSGLGKTHLLQAVANELAARDGALVACLGAQDFTQELIEAIERDRVNVWRARYRRVTALCIDDIHLLQGKDRTQEELFWLFDQLLGQHRQLVFTSAVPVRELTGLEARLRSRLEGGLVVTLNAPERELRLGVVERALHERLGASDPELAAYLAGRPAESLRAVLGLVQRLLGAAEAQNVAPSAGLAREVLEGPMSGAERKSGASRRSSGIVVTTSGGVKSAEKMVWDWPDLADRLVEDLR